MSEKEMGGIQLPTERRKARAVNPGMFLIYSAGKMGKTTIVSQLPNSLLVEMEPRGADYVDANVQEVKNPNQFEEVIKAINDAGNPYDYVIFDTISRLNIWSEIVGTYNYMKKPQGKRFNRTPKGEKMRPSDPQFETVHELANGVGFKHSRDQMSKWYNMMDGTAKNVILLAHIKDKFIESKAGDTVETTDIDLTGKVKGIYCTSVDAVGHFFRRGNEGIINFDNENSVACGGRCIHLDGEIVISEKQEDKSIKTFWDKIYLKE